MAKHVQVATKIAPKPGVGLADRLAVVAELETDEYGQTAFDVQRSRKRFDRMYLRPVDPELREAARARRRTR